jgi:hypothetical protein
MDNKRLTAVERVPKEKASYHCFFSLCSRYTLYTQTTSLSMITDGRSMIELITTK